MKKTSEDFYQDFKSLAIEAEMVIIDLFKQNNITILETSEYSRDWHPIGYCSTLNGWISESIAKVIYKDGEIVLENEYGEELAYDCIPLDEWANILQMVEQELEDNK